MDFALLLDENIDFFISPGSIAFFERFQIDHSFLDSDVSEWKSKKNYQHGLEVLKNLTVVNDVAERGIKLITDYNDRLTHNEDQKQFILQVVADYQRNYPNANKETLLRPLKQN